MPFPDDETTRFGGGSGLPPDLDPRGRRSSGATAGRRRGDALAGVSLGVQVLAAALSLLVLVGSGIAWATYRNFTTNINRVDIGGANAASRHDLDGKDQNILIAGNDDRDTATAAELRELGTTKDGGSNNTDTMMVLHVPADGAKATVISFPRDSYVAIPGHGMNKLNAAYPDGVNDGHGSKAEGARLLIETIQNLTGLRIDHFVQVDLLGFYRISNAIGGVSVCLNGPMGPAKAYGQTGNGLDSGYEPDGTFVYSYSGINLHTGTNIIEGKQALAFVRQRHGLPGGDLDRIKRQQYFLSAVFRKLSSGGVLLNPFKLQKLLRAVTTSLTMDKSLDPLKLAQQMQNLQAGNVRFTTIPTSGDNPNSPVGDVVVVDTAALPDFVANLIGSSSPSAFAKAKAASPASVTVSVVNDANADGLEQANAAALHKLGFRTSVPQATSAVLDKTTIQYPAGAEGAAKAVLAAVPGAVVQQTSSVTSVTLAIGNNGVQVKSLMPKSTGSVESSASSTAPAGSATSSSGGSTVTTAAQAGCIN
jgi:LCP family protein required for cell wall assembly